MSHLIGSVKRLSQWIAVMTVMGKNECRRCSPPRGYTPQKCSCGFRLKVYFRSRFGQFIAESGRSLGYALWSMIELFYEAGTLVATGASSWLPDPFVWDGRTRQWRGPASAHSGMGVCFWGKGVPPEERGAGLP